MKPVKRDLLVLPRKRFFSEEALEHEIEGLNRILLHFESMYHICLANEIIDINSYKIISKANKIEKIIRKGILKPFQFVSNKN